jgi:hypothetical protein
VRKLEGRDQSSSCKHVRFPVSRLHGRKFQRMQECVAVRDLSYDRLAFGDHAVSLVISWRTEFGAERSVGVGSSFLAVY